MIFGEIREETSNHLFFDDFGFRIKLDHSKIDRIALRHQYA